MPRSSARFSASATAALALLCLLRPAWTRPLPRGEAAHDLEARLLDDAADGRLDDFSCLEAALIAGGVQDQKHLARCCRQFERLQQSVQNGVQPMPTSSRKQLARQIFELMHREVLIGQYQLECSQLHRTLYQGHYNCVTASFVYHGLCRSYGLQPMAILTADHVFTSFAGPEAFEVHTTCPSWFAVADDPQRLAWTVEHNAALRNQAAGFRRALTDVQLLGKVYYNRGVVWLQRQRYADAVRAFQISLRLDAEHGSARQNLLAAINDWALAEGDARRFEEAAALLASGRAIDADYAPFAVNDLHIHQKWVQHLCLAGEYQAALEVLEQAYQRRPDAALFDAGRFAVYSMWASQLLAEGKSGAAVERLQRARQRYGADPQMQRTQDAWYEHQVDQLIQRGQVHSALALLDQALRIQPNSDKLQSLRRHLTASEL